MARKGLRKKRAWQAFCRRQVSAGFINDERGGWIRLNETSGTYKNMHRDQLAGYRLGASKRKIRTRVKEGDVE